VAKTYCKKEPCACANVPPTCQLGIANFSPFLHWGKCANGVANIFLSLICNTHEQQLDVISFLRISARSKACEFILEEVKKSRS
jgi:hypothetical protein